MELRYDWKNFEETFKPLRRSALSKAQAALSPAFFIVQDKIVISAFAEAEDVSEWLGSSVDAVKAHFSHRDLVFVDRAHVDQWFKAARKMPHFYEQIHLMKTLASTTAHVISNNGKQEVIKSLTQHHFLLDALKGAWSRFLPRSYGVLIRVDSDQKRDFLVVIRGGVVETFHRPDYSMMSSSREEDMLEAVKYLSEKNGVPVQGLSVTSEDWEKWSQTSAPWRSIVVALKSKKAKLAPFRWRVFSLLTAKALWD